MNDKLKGLMDKRMQELGMQPAPPSVTANPTVHESLPCFEIRAAEGFSEHFVDFRLADGNRVAFAYAELTYINFDVAESRLDLNFRGCMVCLYGQNLDRELYDSFMDCRVRWIREAVEEEAPSLTETIFVERIEIIPPDDDYSAEDTDMEAGDSAQENEE